MLARQQPHELLELIFPVLRGREKLLNQLEHGNNVPLRRRAELRNQQNRRGQKSLGGIIKIRVFPKGVGLHAGEDNRLGDDLCVLFRLGTVGQLVRKGKRQIHITIHEVQKVVAA